MERQFSEGDKMLAFKLSVSFKLASTQNTVAHECYWKGIIPGAKLLLLNAAIFTLLCQSSKSAPSPTQTPHIDFMPRPFKLRKLAPTCRLNDI